MKNGKIQAKDLDEAAIVAAIVRQRVAPWPITGAAVDGVRWVHVDEIENAIGAPRKVVLAKLRAMARLQAARRRWFAAHRNVKPENMPHGGRR